MRLSHYKKYCPLCKNQPCEQLGDYIFRCIRCGHTVNEQQDPALHNRVLVAKPSIYHHGKKYIIKEGQTRSQYFRQIRKEFEHPVRYDKDSMYNPNNLPNPGMSTKGKWMSSQYANLATDFSQEELDKMFAQRRK
jgi:hypothetical protein